MPPEITSHILDYLSISELLQIREVSNALNDYSQRNLFHRTDSLAMATKKKLATQGIWNPHTVLLESKLFFDYLKESDCGLVSQLAGFLQIINRSQEVIIPKGILDDVLAACKDKNNRKFALETLCAFAPFLNDDQIKLVLATLKEIEDDLYGYSLREAASNIIAILAPRLNKDQIESLISRDTLDALASSLTPEQVKDELKKVEPKEEMSKTEIRNTLNVYAALHLYIPGPEIERLSSWVISELSKRDEYDFLQDAAMLCFRTLMPHLSVTTIKSAIPCVESSFYHFNPRIQQKKVFSKLLLELKSEEINVMYLRMKTNFFSEFYKTKFNFHNEIVHGILHLIGVLVPHLNADQFEDMWGDSNILLQTLDPENIDRIRMTLLMLIHFIPLFQKPHIRDMLNWVEQLDLTKIANILNTIVLLISKMIPILDESERLRMFRFILFLSRDNSQGINSVLVRPHAIAVMGEFIPYLNEPFPEIVFNEFKCWLVMKHLLESIELQGLITKLVVRLKVEWIERLFFDTARLLLSSIKENDRDWLLAQTVFKLIPYLDKEIITNVMMLTHRDKSYVLNVLTQLLDTDKLDAVEALSHLLLTEKCSVEQFTQNNIPDSFPVRLMYFMHGCYRQAQISINQKVSETVTNNKAVFFQANAAAQAEGQTPQDGLRM